MECDNNLQKLQVNFKINLLKSIRLTVSLVQYPLPPPSPPPPLILFVT